MLIVLAILFAAGFPGMNAPADQIGVSGFDSKGQLVYRVKYGMPKAKGTAFYSFMVVADESGAPVREAALTNDDAAHASAEGQALLAQAEPRAAADALAKQFPEVDARQPEEDDLVFPGPHGAKVTLDFKAVGRDCVLTAQWTDGARTVSGVLFRDRRPTHGIAHSDQVCVEANTAVVFRADGHRAAVATNMMEDLGRSRAYLAYVSIKDLATVQFLDAGAGKSRVDELTAIVNSSGFHLGPAVQAKAKRAANQIYARKGFEPEAALLAKLVGADSVLPLDWDSCCAISVALAK